MAGRIQIIGACRRSKSDVPTTSRGRLLTVSTLHEGAPVHRLDIRFNAKLLEEVCGDERCCVKGWIINGIENDNRFAFIARLFDHGARFVHVAFA